MTAPIYPTWHAAEWGRLCDLWARRYAAEPRDCWVCYELWPDGVLMLSGLEISG